MHQTTTEMTKKTNPASGRAFPTQETNLYKILNESQHRQKFHAQLKRYNPLVVGLYRIGLMPLFGVSRSVMVLTTRGCKSGKIRSTPIGYFLLAGWSTYFQPGASAQAGMPTFPPTRMKSGFRLACRNGLFMRKSCKNLLKCVAPWSNF